MPSFYALCKSATPRTRDSLDDPFSGELLLSRFLGLAIDAENFVPETFSVFTGRVVASMRLMSAVRDSLKTT